MLMASPLCCPAALQVMLLVRAALPSLMAGDVLTETATPASAAACATVSLSAAAGVLTETTAELAAALTLAGARRVVEGDKFMRAHQYKGWLPDLFVGNLLQRKTLGEPELGCMPCPCPSQLVTALPLTPHFGDNLFCTKSSLVARCNACPCILLCYTATLKMSLPHSDLLRASHAGVSSCCIKPHPIPLLRPPQ